MFRSYLATLLLLCVVRVLFAQEKSWQQIDTARQKIDSTTRQLSQLPDKYFSQVSNKTDKLQKQLTRRTDKALSRFLKQEQRLQQKLGKIDSVAAKKYLYPLHRLPGQYESPPQRQITRPCR
ncbi:hypothetical protein [Chitinophaga sp. MD30]|uniref:hypothetical protein n=1 Tax=Chitinophaga sp. MD30 TaxID=2033437 RepID=UPI000BB033D6|nr:hypothetical protein [Chitinophaga sp. MD30]ASZ13528.1 hypothetical protein CK934_22525 [Chitinophaga sp. MD30]